MAEGGRYEPLPPAQHPTTAASSKVIQLVNTEAGQRAMEAGQRAKEKGQKGAANLRAALGTDVSGFQNEVANKIEQYVAWRKCRLTFALIPFGGWIISQIYTIFGYRVAAYRLVVNNWGEEFLPYFYPLVLCSRLELWMCLFSAMIAWVLSCTAIRIKRKTTSILILRVAIAVDVLSPFFVYLILPYKGSVDIQGLEQRACRDWISRMNNITTVQQYSQRPLVHQILHHIVGQMDGTEVSDEVCDADSSTWGERFLEYSVASGRLRVDNACVRSADRLHNWTMDVGANMSLDALALMEAQKECTLQCEVSDQCSSTCPTYLGPLSVMMGVYGVQTVFEYQPNMIANIDLNCRPCLEDAFTCINACNGLKSFVDAQKASFIKHSSVCLTESEMADLSIVVDTFAQAHKSVIAALLGGLFALRNFVMLLPLALSVGTGLDEGTQLASSVLKGSQFPTFVAAIISFVNLPLILCLLVYYQNFVGNWFFAAGMSIYVVEYIAISPLWIIVGGTHGLIHSFFTDWRVKWPVKLVTLTCFVLGVYEYRDTYRLCVQVAEHVNLRSGLEFYDQLYDSASSTIGYFVIRLVLVWFGQSMVFGVFFADLCIQLTYFFHRADWLQEEETRENLWLEIEGLRDIMEDGLAESDRIPSPKIGVLKQTTESGFSSYTSSRTFWCCTR